MAICIFIEDLTYHSYITEPMLKKRKRGFLPSNQASNGPVLFYLKVFPLVMAVGYSQIMDGHRPPAAK